MTKVDATVWLLWYWCRASLPKRDFERLRRCWAVRTRQYEAEGEQLGKGAGEDW